MLLPSLTILLMLIMHIVHFFPVNFCLFHPTFIFSFNTSTFTDNYTTYKNKNSLKVFCPMLRKMLTNTI